MKKSELKEYVRTYINEVRLKGAAKSTDGRLPVFVIPSGDQFGRSVGYVYFKTSTGKYIEYLCYLMGTEVKTGANGKITYTGPRVARFGYSPGQWSWEGYWLKNSYDNLIETFINNGISYTEERDNNNIDVVDVAEGDLNKIYVHDHRGEVNSGKYDDILPTYSKYIHS